MLLSPWRRTWTRQRETGQSNEGGGQEEAAHLSAQVHYVGVGVVEGQQDSVTGVHLLDAYRLVHVVLETRNTTVAGMLIVSEGHRGDLTVKGQRRTDFHKASWRSLMRLNPVVKMFPSARKMALIGRAPSWALSFS